MNNPDFTNFYEKYFQQSNKKISIYLKNKESITCSIVGFYYKNNEIFQWRIIVHTHELTAGLLNNQLFQEKLILVKDIKDVLLHSNLQLFTF